MSSDKTALGDRMKDYEAVTRFVLPRRTHTILRVDGRAFHTYLKGAIKPFDYGFMDDMAVVVKELCNEVTGTVFAYAQSDEISLLITDFKRQDTQPWFGGVIQKMVSNAASVASANLTRLRLEQRPAYFDARVYTIPDATEVANYFLWRQRDAVRNSISMLAQHHFSHKELQGKSGNEMQDMLFTQRGVNWNDIPDACKRGRVCTREDYAEDVTYKDERTGEEVTVSAQRSRWSVGDAPHFTADPVDWLAQTIVVDREN